MAPHTIGGLADRMAHGGHIRRENYKFIGVKGPAPASAYSYSPNLCHGDLGPVARGGHTLETVLGSIILEFAYVGGPVPSLVSSHGYVLRPGGWKSMDRGELT
jgi:hypothetical protein